MRPGPLQQPVSGFGIRSFWATWVKVLPKGTEMWARARVAVWAGVSFVWRALPRRWAARTQQSQYQWGPGPRAFGSASQSWAAVLYRYLVQYTVHLVVASAPGMLYLGVSNGTLEGPLFGAWRLASQLGSFSSQPGEERDLRTVVVLG